MANSSADSASEISDDVIEGQDNECIENYRKKIEELKKVSSNKNVERRLLKRSMDYLCVTEFLNKEVLSPDKDECHKNSITEEEKKPILELLQEIEKVNKIAKEISKENRNLEREIINKKLCLKNSMEKRRKLWNEAVKKFELASGASSDLADLESIAIQREKEKELETVNMGIAVKSSRIVDLSRILHNLICFSGMSWATDENLLEIVLCTGKILERNFTYENKKELRKIVDDTIHRLNFVKI